jgi:hypothetical protein
LTIRSDAEGRDSLASFQGIVARAVKNETTHQLRMPSGIHNGRARAKRNPQQIHFSSADRIRHGFNIVHVVFGREIGPVTIGEAAPVAVVQYHRPVFGKSPEVLGCAWCHTKPFEVAYEARRMQQHGAAADRRIGGGCAIRPPCVLNVEQGGATR